MIVESSQAGLRPKLQKLQKQFCFESIGPVYDAYARTSLAVG